MRTNPGRWLLPMIGLAAAARQEPGSVLPAAGPVDAEPPRGTLTPAEIRTRAEGRRAALKRNRKMRRRGFSRKRSGR